MPQLPFAGLTILVSVALGGLLPAIFVPWGLPAAWLVAGTILVLVAARLRPQPPADAAFAAAAMRTVAWCFAAYLLSFLATTLYNGGSVRELDKPIRYALGIALLLGLMRARVEPSIIRSLILLAAVAALGYALFDRMAHGVERVGAFMNEIQFGVLAAQVASLNAVLAVDRFRQDRGQSLLFTGGAIAGAAAAGMSGSLTAMVSLAAVPLALLLMRWHRPSLRSVLVVLLLVSAAAAALVQTRSQIVTRGLVAVDEIATYQDFKSGAVAISSNGARLENFQNAWGIFLTSPLLGVGTQGYLALRQAQVKRGELTAFSGTLGVAHNEYLDAMAKRGLLGLAGLLALLLGPMWVFRKICASAGDDAKAWAVAGFVVCAGLALASLTQNVLTHSTGANFMVVAVALFLRLALQAPGPSHPPVSGAASLAP